MKSVNYAYDTLFYRVFESEGFAFSIRIKKYRLKSKNPLIVANVSKVPVINDFSDLSDDIYNLQESFEVRLSSILTLDEMKCKVYKLLRDRFLQQDLFFD